MGFTTKKKEVMILKIFQSQTYGKLDIEKIPEKLNKFYVDHKKYGTPIRITIGTDSQNHDTTKVVTVIAITCDGHGGIFFHHTEHLDRINSIKQKLQEETGKSLETAMVILDIAEKQYPKMIENTSFAIHVDVGVNGRTKTLIKELVGWVQACGYDCKIKPDSYAASSIADRISK